MPLLPVVVLNCRCDSVHQPAQQRDFVAVRGRRLLLGFENHRELGHGRIVDQSREERDAELPFADVGVTVLMRALAKPITSFNWRITPS